MPLNLLKTYNQLLELGALNEQQRKKSLLGIFNRDFVENEPINFNGKRITPTPIDGNITMATLFTHLTCKIEDQKIRNRVYDNHRSIRLHWVRFHLSLKKSDVLIFSVKEPEGNRTYIYDKEEKYVIVLEPLRNKTEYYLLSAYHLTGKDAQRDKILSKYRKRRLPEVL